MNKVLAIILLIILLVILIYILKTILPAFARFITGLPKGIFIILLAGIVGLMGYLVFYLINSSQYGGVLADPASSVDIPDPDEEIVAEKIDNCIILRNDEIWIDNQIVDVDFLKTYIDERVESNTEITVVDDYSLSSLHHEITSICNEKGVNYRNEDEKWLEQ